MPRDNTAADGEARRIDAAIEVACFRHGGTLPFVLRQLPGIG